MTRIFFMVIFLLGSLLTATSQTYLAASNADELRFRVWLYRDGLPTTDLADPADPRASGLRSEQLFEPVSSASPQTRLPAAAHLLELARYTANALTTGFSFGYTPSDRARSVAEYFELVPEPGPTWGDAALEAVTNYSDDRIVDYEFRYILSDAQKSYRSAWMGPSVPDARGTGTASLLDDLSGYIRAVQEAIKAGIRSHAQGLTHEKPAYVRGLVLLSEAPRVWAAQGMFHADLRFRVRILEVRHYRVF